MCIKNIRYIRFIHVEQDCYSIMIDLEKVEKNRPHMDLELSYVDHIINDALFGLRTGFYNPKYNFADTPEWWDRIIAGSEDKDLDSIIVFFVRTSTDCI